MDIKYYGANCLKVSTKKVSLVIDDTLESNGKKSISKNCSIALKTNKELPYGKGADFEIDTPGEYEVNEISVMSIPSKLHYDTEKTCNIYSVRMAGFSIAVLGHTVADLSEDQIEALGIVDVLIIPVGGGGYTLDSIEAVKLIKQIDPKIVVPTHYGSKDIKYEVSQAPIDEFIKSVGSSEIEKVDVLKLKSANLPDKTQVFVVNQQ